MTCRLSRTHCKSKICGCTACISCRGLLFRITLRVEGMPSSVLSSRCVRLQVSHRLKPRRMIPLNPHGRRNSVADATVSVFSLEGEHSYDYNSDCSNPTH